MYRLEDVDFMREALRLAGEGTGLASPNPCVGAIVVRDGEIVGRGTHLYDERSHAEVLALAEAGERARGATLYLNLEPCCHSGRTPPCTDAVIAAGVARVVAAMRDPNPRVAGEGLRRLEAAGIKAESGCLERDARRLNEGFCRWITTGLPFVTLKSALTLDGRIGGAGGTRVAISSQPARGQVQQMRHAADALLTGVGTVLADDPLLTDRSKRPRRRPLLRVVLDAHLRTPLTAQLLKNARRRHDVLILHCDDDAEKAKALDKAGARLERVAADAHGQPDLAAVLHRLGELEIVSVLLEAGATLNAAMLEAGLVDKLALFIAPKLLGAAAVPMAAPWTRLPRAPLGPLICESVGPDVLIETYMTAPGAELEAEPEAASSESTAPPCSPESSRP